MWHQCHNYLFFLIHKHLDPLFSHVIFSYIIFLQRLITPLINKIVTALFKKIQSKIKKKLNTPHTMFVCKKIQLWLLCKKILLMLTAFSNSVQPADLDDCRSVLCYCVQFGRSLVSWCSERHSVVSHSNTKAQYQSLALVVPHIMFTRTIFFLLIY